MRRKEYVAGTLSVWPGPLKNRENPRVLCQQNTDISCGAEYSRKCISLRSLLGMFRQRPLDFGGHHGGGYIFPARH